MTELDLDAIEGRVMLTSPGPWRLEVPPDKGYPQRVYSRDNGLVAECFLGPQYPLAEAEFIAAARTDVPRLIVEVRALTGERDRLRAAVDAALTVADRFESFAQQWRKGSSPDTPIGQRNEIRADVYDAAAEQLRAALTAADPTQEDK